MKVLVTGATGFLGGEIARELVRRGHQVRVLVRSTSKLENVGGVEKAVGDILDRASVEAALAGMQAVIHTAGHTGQRKRDFEAVMAVNFEGTRNVLGAAKAAGLRTVHTSSMTAIGATVEPVVQTEESEWTGGDVGYVYAISKRRGEDHARELAAQGLDVVILCPGLILGSGDMHLSSTRYVLEYLRGRNRAHFDRGGNSYCHVHDVARAHVAALEGKGRRGERYILTGHNSSQKETIERLYRLTGLHKPMHVPWALAWTAGLLSQTAALLFQHSAEDLNLPLLRYARRYAYSDCSKAQRELDYHVTPFDDILRETIGDLVARGHAKPAAAMVS